LGYTFLCANDHLVYQRPWLDGPTALAAVMAHSGSMRLATTIALPVIRGPAATAKMLAALDLLSGGRVVAGLWPGSSERDYLMAGIPYAERWKRFEESVHTVRAYLSGGDYAGEFYSTEGERLEPRPIQQPAPPIWLGSWGARGGLRRTASLGDGWMASGFNTTPERFAESMTQFSEHLREAGKDPAAFPNGISTMMTYVCDDPGEADRVMMEKLGGALHRPAEELRGILPVGPPEECARLLRAYKDAGAQRVFIWPLADEAKQLALFMEQVAPLVEKD
jgi:alkanesulfonate monooxygenase SsuD/methylene tetrahydromethanopterin reductase-like flavin-dependent oxidoreductase (luciferase family)